MKFGSQRKILGGKIVGEKWDNVEGKKLKQDGCGWPDLSDFVRKVARDTDLSQPDGARC